jgi:phage shock protein A
MAARDTAPIFFKRYHVEKWAFGAVFLTGAVAIVLFDLFEQSKVIAVIVCAALMGLYATGALAIPGLRLRADQAADNCYYMGLLFTLTSLGLALFRFASSDLASQSVLRNFGIAIFTTIVGLGLRVAIGQFREDPDDLEYEAKEALTATVREMRARLEQSIAELQRFCDGARQALGETLDTARATTNEAMTAGVARFDAALVQSAKSLTENAAGFNKRVSTLSASTDRAVRSFEAIVDRVDSIAVDPDMITAGLNPAFDVFRSSVGLLASDLEGERARIKRSVDALARLGESATQLDNSSAAFAGASAHLREGAESLGRGAGVTAELEAAIVAAAKSTNDFTKALGSAAAEVGGQAGRSMTAINEATGDLTRRSSAALVEVEAAAARVKETMQGLKQEFAGSSATVEHVRRELTELASWIIERLDQAA